jgi:hypothetical protein
MSRVNALTEIDGIALKRGREALQALHNLELKFVEKGYVTGDDIELMRGAQYNLEAVLALTARCITTINDWAKDK